MNKKLKDFLSTSLYLLCVLGVCLLILKYVGQRTDVYGRSMMPTLQDGNSIILDKITYRLHDPERFDIIVFPFRDSSNKNYIKRIIGLPGETVQIDTDGNIYINGEILSESYGREVMTNPGRAISSITLGSDEYFVLGDNRNDSEDSRFTEVGNVKRSEILGRAWFRIWPFNEMGLVNKK